MKKTIGILGGMGPEATAYMFELIIKKTKVEKDQDHIPMIIYNNPKIPSRSYALFKMAPSPTPLLLEGVRILKQAGADFIVMPCITAHYFYREVASKVSFPFVSLLDESLTWAQKNIPGLKKAGLIASTGTIKTRLFHDTFAKAGIDVISPDEEEQKQVMEAIFGSEGIKAGCASWAPKELIVNTARILIGRGAEAIIAGCTEVPLVLEEKDIPAPLIEPMEIAAEVSILKAGYEVRSRKR